jgi:hypothetical protein
MIEHISGNAEQVVSASGIIDKMLLNNAAGIWPKQLFLLWGLYRLLLRDASEFWDNFYEKLFVNGPDLQPSYFFIQILYKIRVRNLFRNALRLYGLLPLFLVTLFVTNMC